MVGHQDEAREWEEHAGLRAQFSNPDGCFDTWMGSPPKQVMFGAFPDDSRLCVIQCLRRYEVVTQHYRTKDPNSSQPLFLSYVKPHGPVTSQRLAH